MGTQWSARLLWLGAILLCWQLPLRAETLVVYGDDSYAPVIYLDAGKPAGTLVDILQAVGQKTGEVYDLQLRPWKRAYEEARSGQGALVGASLTAERSALFDFSDPIYADDIQVVVRRDRAFVFNQLKDLKGKVMGGVIGASYGQEVDQAIKDGLFTVDLDIGQSSRLLKLLAGRMDGALIGNGQAGFEAVLHSSPELLAQRNQLLVLKTPLTRDMLYFAIPKSMNKRDAIERFN
ncbi:MAG: transporter substrate-binding domain-containing protein, partial [Rhodoferax sp.]|nr:transporter substrate-binding domain-containing protein [Rhodoferax sp.]